MSAANTPPPSRNDSQPSTIDNAPFSRTDYDPFVNGRPGYYPATRSSYRPTAEQLARDEERRRYLRRNVYLPIIITVVIVIALFVLIVLLAFGVVSPPAASFVAGLSGLTIILASIPFIVLMSIMPIAWLAFVLHRRQQRKNFPETGPMAYRSRVQTLFWQTDRFFDGTQGHVEQFSVNARKPLMAMHSRIAYIKGFLRGLIKRFTRSN